jgi:hypothetical protein
LLLTLLRGFIPASRTEHIPKYSSIEKFVKLTFQWVLIRLNRSPNEGAMAVSLQHCLLSRISACATMGDSAIPLVGTTDCLAAWFVGMQTSWSFWNFKYIQLFSAEVVQGILMT